MTEQFMLVACHDDDDRVLKKQQQANPGMIGGCAGVALEYKQACINSWCEQTQRDTCIITVHQVQHASATPHTHCGPLITNCLL